MGSALRHRGISASHQLGLEISCLEDFVHPRPVGTGKRNGFEIRETNPRERWLGRGRAFLTGGNLVTKDRFRDREPSDPAAFDGERFGFGGVKLRFFDAEVGRGGQLV